MSRMTFAEGVSSANLQNDLATQFLSGVVGRVETAHISLTEKGRSKASITGSFTGITFDKIRTPVITTGVLFNPSLLEKLRIFFEENDCAAFINEKGEVSKTAPSEPSTDKVVSKTELEKERTEIQGKFFSLTEADQKVATARLEAIEKALKTA